MDYCADGGMGSGWGYEQPHAYGLGAFDPSLEGFNPFKIVTAPFRAGAKVVAGAAKQVIRHGPRTALGFIAGGPIGAAAALASPLIRGGSPSQTTSYSTGIAPTTIYQNPVATSFRQTSGSLVPTQQQAQQSQSIVQQIRSELLRQGGQYIAGTPEGQAAIRQRVTGDLGRYMLPLAIGGGVLVLALALRR